MASVVSLANLILAFSACSEMSTEVQPARAPDAVSASHMPWGGCTAWNGLSFATVFFAKGSAELDAEDRAALDRNVALLNLCPAEGFHVVGKSVKERKGSQLAAARAQVVAEYYVSHGLTGASRMAVSSYIMAGCGKRWGPCERFWATETW
jgi:outer membrane protein OmpA-like peptidoglycan-associated protein